MDFNCRTKKEIKVEMHAYIKGHVELGIPPKQVFKELINIYGPSTLSYMSLYMYEKNLKMATILEGQIHL